jgi:hypothetical protein
MRGFKPELTIGCIRNATENKKIRAAMELVHDVCRCLWLSRNIGKSACRIAPTKCTRSRENGLPGQTKCTLARRKNEKTGPFCFFAMETSVFFSGEL